MLKELHRRRGPSQKKQASAIGVHNLQISKYETGADYFPRRGKIIESPRSTGAARGFTQGELAERVGIELVQISRYERGQALPNAETLISLAEVLKTETDVLLRGEASPQHEATAGVDLDLPLLERFRDLQKLPKRDRGRGHPPHRQRPRSR